MIPAEFEEVELSRDYTDYAKGGPMFETGMVGNTPGTQQRNINRQDAIREYEIQFEGANNWEIDQLEQFFVTKYGRAIGFRFYPARDRRFQGDLIGIGDGVETDFKLKRIYTGGSVTIERRIVKPVVNDLLLSVSNGSTDEYAGLSDGAGGWLMPSWSDIDFGGGVPLYIVTVDWNTGDVVFDVAPPNLAEIRAVGGDYNVPVFFESDKFESTDYSTFSDWSGVKLVEALPIVLGIVQNIDEQKSKNSFRQP